MAVSRVEIGARGILLQPSALQSRHSASSRLSLWLTFYAPFTVQVGSGPHLNVGAKPLTFDYKERAYDSARYGFRLGVSKMRFTC